MTNHNVKIKTIFILRFVFTNSFIEFFDIGLLKHPHRGVDTDVLR